MGSEEGRKNVVLNTRPTVQDEFGIGKKSLGKVFKSGYVSFIVFFSLLSVSGYVSSIIRYGNKN